MSQVKYTKEQMKSMSQEDLVNDVINPLAQELEEKQAMLRLCQEEIALLKQRLFGRKTEKYVVSPNEQLSIEFNEAEAVADTTPDEEPAIEETITYTRKKRVGKRKEDLSGLPVKVEEYTLSEEELKKEFESEEYYRLPDQITRKLEFVPAKAYVLEKRVAVYAGRKSQKIIKAPKPKEMLNNSVATPSLVASIMNAKYSNAMTFYRLERDFEQAGIVVARQNMAHWIIKCTEVYLSLIYDRLKELLCQRHVIQADETPVEVTKDGRPAGSKSYMWVYRTSELQPEHPIILYDYRKTRNSTNPEEFLKGFSGILVCDGYTGYTALQKRNTSIKIANCFVHVRRPFAELDKAMPEKMKDKSIASKALYRIQKIFKKEAELKNLSTEERLKQRRLAVKPLVEAFFEWVNEIKDSVAPSSTVGKGLAYALEREEYLKVFLDDGDVPMQNSASERSIRPFTIARKNFVMIDTIRGAEASAVVFSLVETAKANQLNIYEYFKYLLTEIPQHLDGTDISFVDKLLPWSTDLPKTCKLK